MVRPRQVLCALAGVCLLATAPFAQDARPTPASADPDGAPAREYAAPALGAVRVEAGQRPEIDGRLDEAVWAEAPAATGFVQLQPDAGQPATERTVAHVLYDGSALYVAFRAYVRDSETLVAPLSRRDQNVVTDRVLVQVASVDREARRIDFIALEREGAAAGARAAGGAGRAGSPRSGKSKARGGGKERSRSKAGGKRPGRTSKGSGSGKSAPAGGRRGKGGEGAESGGKRGSSGRSPGTGRRGRKGPGKGGPKGGGGRGRK